MCIIHEIILNPTINDKFIMLCQWGINKIKIIWA